jgi:hypothetical protein
MCANQSTNAAASFGLKKIGAIALIASAPALCAATANARASGKLLWPMCAMNFTPCARAASPHAANNSARSSVVSEWHSPVVPATNAPATPFAAKCAACSGTQFKLSEKSP